MRRYCNCGSAIEISGFECRKCFDKRLKEEQKQIDHDKAFPLETYSTTQLKRELRRRKEEKRGNDISD